MPGYTNIIYVLNRHQYQYLTHYLFSILKSFLEMSDGFLINFVFKLFEKIV